MTGGFVALALGFTVRTYRRKVATGREALVGARAKVLDWDNGAGHVWVASERWRAVGPKDLAPGSWTRVEAVDSLTVTVTPQGDAS